jgi:hypothetical protein
MPRYRAYIIQPMGTSVEVEADSSEEVPEKVWASSDYPSSRGIGGGWEVDGEAYISEIEPIEE